MQSKPLRITDIGSFHIGGKWLDLHNAAPRDLQFTNVGTSEHTSVDGRYWSGALYVQYFKPEDAQDRPSLLLWHGGGLCGTFYETTPDGRDGWLKYFLSEGWSVFNCDGPERGRAGWIPYNELQSSEAVLNARHVAYERFRIGPETLSVWQNPGDHFPYPASQFPVDAYDRFVMQQVPRWTDSDDVAIAAYCELVQKVAPSVIVSHSQGAQYALHVAMLHPGHVSALVLIEPSGVCDPTLVQIQEMAKIPMLVVYGDNIASSARWRAIRKRTDAFFAVLRESAARIDVLDLPKIGIFGNSHLIPIDRNNQQVAEIIARWLTDQGVLEKPAII